MRNKKEAGIACFLLRFRENQRITGRRGPLSFLRYPDMVGTKEQNFMMPIIYSLFAYALTAAISYIVVGIIVLIDRTMSKQAAAGKEK